jgi:heterodisulfide reductase subunit B
MKVLYYPGCTLKTSAKNFEDSAIASLKMLGVDLVELERWNCCGTVYSLTSDDLIHKVAPIRNLIRVKEQGDDRVVTLCSMCYNTLKQANDFFREDEESRNKINDFMDREIDYKGDVEVLHILTFLKEEIGFNNIAKKVKNKLSNLKVAPYYGCLLLRPENSAIDDAENPTILEDLFNSLGIDVVDFPYRNECCGSYNTVNAVDLVVERTYKIINSARSLGANIIATSCPLCQFNLDRRQKDVKDKYYDFEELPVVYFTQIMGRAFDVARESLRFDLNYINPVLLS